jgi:hypothetical protein
VAAVSAWSPANPEDDPDGLRLELKQHARRELGELVVGIVGLPAGQRLGSSVAFSDAISDPEKGSRT